MRDKLRESHGIGVSSSVDVRGASLAARKRQMEEENGRMSDVGLRDPAVRMPDLGRAAQVALEGDVRDEMADDADMVRGLNHRLT